MFHANYQRATPFQSRSSILPHESLRFLFLLSRTPPFYRVSLLESHGTLPLRNSCYFEITDVEELLNAPLNEIQMIKGGLTVESNLSELVEEVDLDTKIHITGNEVEIPVGRLVYDKLKGKKIKVVVKE